MGDFLPDVLVAFASGLLGGVLGRRFAPRLRAPVPRALQGHEHDWHVDGKVEGVVVRKCSVCGEVSRG